MNNNDDLQSRRDFFKRVGKGVLPILGASVLSSVPIQTVQAAGCVWGCSFSCGNSCSIGADKAITFMEEAIAEMQNAKTYNEAKCVSDYYNKKIKNDPDIALVKEKLSSYTYKNLKDAVSAGIITNTQYEKMDELEYKRKKILASFK